jgi:hypothetical protein
MNNDNDQCLREADLERWVFESDAYVKAQMEWWLYAREVASDLLVKARESLLDDDRQGVTFSSLVEHVARDNAALFIFVAADQQGRVRSYFALGSREYVLRAQSNLNRKWFGK